MQRELQVLDVNERRLVLQRAVFFFVLIVRYLRLGVRALGRPPSRRGGNGGPRERRRNDAALGCKDLLCLFCDGRDRCRAVELELAALGATARGDLFRRELCIVAPKMSERGLRRCERGHTLAAARAEVRLAREPAGLAPRKVALAEEPAAPQNQRMLWLRNPNRARGRVENTFAVWVLDARER